MTGARDNPVYDLDRGTQTIPTPLIQAAGAAVRC